MLPTNVRLTNHPARGQETTWYFYAFDWAGKARSFQASAAKSETDHRAILLQKAQEHEAEATMIRLVLAETDPEEVD